MGLRGAELQRSDRKPTAEVVAKLRAKAVQIESKSGFSLSASRGGRELAFACSAAVAYSPLARSHALVLCGI